MPPRNGYLLTGRGQMEIMWDAISQLHLIKGPLRQRLPAGTKYERIEPKTLTKFEVGAD